ncbi:hypothetical protein KI387_033544, partial [Taxus chinensis]
FLLLIVIQSLLNFSSADIGGDYVKSRATHYGSPEQNVGACGYGSFGRNININAAGASQYIYNNGIGCGACYQVRCIYEELCIHDGIRIIVTDLAEGNQTDLTMSSTAFSDLAKHNKANQLMQRGVVDIELKRISCEYPGHNLTVKIDESSNFPDYLALVFWYRGGKKDLLGVQLFEENSEENIQMKRNHGTVWDLVSPPKVALGIRFFLVGYHRAGFEWVKVAN